MIKIRPSASTSLVRSQQLSRQVISDIKTLLVFYKNEHNRSLSSEEVQTIAGLLKTLSYFSAKLKEASHDQRWQIVSPELYQWYFKALGILKAKEWNLFKECISDLSQQILPRLLSLGFQINEIPILLDSEYKIHFPQVRKIYCFPKVNGKLVKSRLENKTMLLENNQHRVKINIKRLLENLEDSQWSQRPRIAGTSIYYKQSGDELGQVIKTIASETSMAKEEASELCNVSWHEFFNDKLYINSRRKIDRAMRLIKNISPTFYEEVVSVTHAFSLLKNTCLIGATVISYYGVCFLNPRSDWNVITFADHIVHEAAHQILYAWHELSPLLVNCNEMGYPSPIRDDPRPLYGSFHATFVFLRLVLFFDQLVRKTKSREAEFRFHRHLQGLYTGMDVLEKAAKFTPKGKELFQAMKFETARFKKRIPRPDPKAYNRYLRDYSN